MATNQGSSCSISDDEWALTFDGLEKRIPAFLINEPMIKIADY
jgi:hypothetical protein